MKTVTLLTLLISALTISCKDSEEKGMQVIEWRIDLPAHFEELPVPEKNPMNEAKVELGAKLFYDPILSKDSSVSCSSCHFPHLAFSDGLAKSFGLNDSISMRNSPVLVNLAYANSYMMDGGIPSLELQVAAPILHEGEMGFDLFAIAEKLQQNEIYQHLSEEAFSRPIDAGAIAYSLAAFERSLLSYESAYDQYLEGDEYALGTLAKRGKELFFSDSLNCAACHSGVNFTDYAFYSIGLYTEYTDQGRWRITENVKDEGKFKTPTLRNIGLSAPYMHDGSIENLMGVINFKMSGGNDHPNKSDKLKGFYLNEGDKLALLAFLESLDDAAFVEREVTRKETL